VLIAVNFVAAVAPSTAAMAANITVQYSQGTLKFDTQRTVTVGKGGDFANCTKAIQSFKIGGPGGIIEFLPGKHVASCYAANDRGNLMITGRLGPNGERPEITTPTITNSKSGAKIKSNFISFVPRADRAIVIQNLDISDTAQAITASNFGAAIVRNVRIDGTNRKNGIVADRAIGQYAGKFKSSFDIYDSEVAHGGNNNTKHNIYLGRIDEVYIDGLYSHSALNSHALKLVARNVTVKNSVFRTTAIPFSKLKPNEAYLSTTLIDIASCSQSVIENNKFIGVNLLKQDRSNGGWGASTQSMIDYKRRRDIAGCDDPPYDSQQFKSAAFWQAAKAGGYDPSNESLFQHIVRGNTFINEGNREIGVAWNNGTGPWDASSKYQFKPHLAPDLPLPNGWFERAVVRLDNNTTTGNLNWGKETTPTTHAQSTGGNPVLVGGVRLGGVGIVNRIQDEPLPTTGNDMADMDFGSSDRGGSPTSGLKSAELALSSAGLSESGDRGGSPTSIAESGALALFGAGLIGFGVAARRQRRK
jgi:hypothetical protein